MKWLERMALDWIPLYEWLYYYRDSRKVTNSRCEAIERTFKLHNQGWF